MPYGDGGVEVYPEECKELDVYHVPLEGLQNRYPQKGSLWQVDYSALRVVGTLWAQEKLSLSFIHIEESELEVFPRIRVIR